MADGMGHQNQASEACSIFCAKARPAVDPIARRHTYPVGPKTRLGFVRLMKVDRLRNEQLRGRINHDRPPR